MSVLEDRANALWVESQRLSELRRELESKGGGNGGGGGSMDPWQASVEKRLDSLDTRVGRIEDKLGDVRETVSAMKTKVDDLPTKWFMVTAIGTIGTVIVAIAKVIEIAF